MSETYVECLVARKGSTLIRFSKILFIMLTVVFVIIGMVFVPGFLVAIVTGVAAYFSYMNADIEYEYLYLDREVSVDKVMAKSRRKRVGSYDLEKMEIFAPLNSHRLDSYKNRQLKTLDYSSGIAAQPEKRYMMIWNGDTKIILEPNAEMIKAIQGISPRKVFTD
ncbi:MAG: DUF6106 family protein [Bacteroidales bacterium]|nr:DUF6106 family protein [Bacteroidales bacterium]MCM1416061.1 DUF6106 family protein [bacterium]MCM1422802.1 DUF6106 family protein [bacterium]